LYAEGVVIQHGLPASDSVNDFNFGLAVGFQPSAFFTAENAGNAEKGILYDSALSAVDNF
jgi:hypothetical protein